MGSHVPRLAKLPCKEIVESSILFGSTKYMVSMPEWFRGHTVDVVYIGSNPITHPNITSMSAVVV